MQEMRVPRSTSSSTKGGKGDQKHGTLEAATGVCSTSSKESGTQPPWGGARFPLAPCGWCSLPPLGGAAVPPWVALPSPLLLGDGVVFPHGQFETVASRQCVKANQATRPVQDGHTGASLTHTVTPLTPPCVRLFLFLCHSLPLSPSSPLSLAPCVSPSLSLPPFLRLSLTASLSLPLSSSLTATCSRATTHLHTRYIESGARKLVLSSAL